MGGGGRKEEILDKRIDKKLANVPTNIKEKSKLNRGQENLRFDKGINGFYFASAGCCNGFKFPKGFNANCAHHVSYLNFRLSLLPQPFCPEGWLDLSILSVKKNAKQNSVQTFCIESFSRT